MLLFLKKKYQQKITKNKKASKLADLPLLVWIAGILYFVLILFLVYKGIVNERELEKGKKFFQEEKAYFERHKEKEKIVFGIGEVLG